MAELAEFVVVVEKLRQAMLLSLSILRSAAGCVLFHTADPEELSVYNMLMLDDASAYKTYVSTRCCGSSRRATENAAMEASLGSVIDGSSVTRIG